jgi:hypothetical protein
MRSSFRYLKTGARIKANHHLLFSYFQTRGLPQGKNAADGGWTANGKKNQTRSIQLVNRSALSAFFGNES